MSGPSSRIDHVVTAFSDLDRTDAFYAAALRAEVQRPMPNFSQYRFAGQMLNVHGPGLATAAGAPLLAREPVTPGNSDLCFEWDGPIEGAATHLAACGVKPHVGPVARSGARGRGTSLYFRDPDGALLEFISYAARTAA